MAASLDVSVVKERLLAVFRIFVQNILEEDDVEIAALNLTVINNRLVRESFEEQITEAFELYILMQTLAANSKSTKRQLDRKHFTVEQWKAYDFVRFHTGKIEI